MSRKNGQFKTDGGAEIRLGVLVCRAAVLMLAVGGIVLEYGFGPRPVLSGGVIHLLQVVLLGLYGFDVLSSRRLGRVAIADEKLDWLDWGMLGLAGIGVVLGILSGQAEGWIVFYLASVLLMVSELWRLNVGIARKFYRPGILLPVSFLMMIGVGTLLLKVPLAVPAGQGISWLDALFTMTSAVCVTGLVVRDTATEFSWFGQAVIGVFIQLGGLGIVVFGSVFAMLMGTRLSMRENISLSRMLNDQPLARVSGLVRFIVIFTILAELIGAGLMVGMWDDGYTLSHRVGLSLFHSVSAFCNAGFSLFSDSLQSQRYAMLTHGVITPLLVIGGLGFPVLMDMIQAGWNRWRFVRGKDGEAVRRIPLVKRRLSLHSKIVLTTTAGLYLYGVVMLTVAGVLPHFYGAMQQGTTANQRDVGKLDVKRFGGILADASFMSLTARTAGFNTVEMEKLGASEQFVLMSLMMVGASPGGTGGGMKTTTLAVLLLTVAATVRQRNATEAFGRQIGEQLVRKAATLMCALVGLIGLAILLLSFSEPFGLNKIAFEAVSAGTTTGLSLGITPELTGFGKCVIMVTMFLGRIGPLALLVSLVLIRGKVSKYSYPEENVIMG